MIGAERRAGRLPLKLPVIGPGPGVPGQAPVRVQALTLGGRENKGLEPLAATRGHPAGFQLKYPERGVM